MREIVIRIQVPDGVTPVVDYTEQEPPHMAEMPPVTSAPVQTTTPLPQCPQHGAMTFHPSKTKPDGKQVSARYSCDVKTNDVYCPTRPVWL